MAASQIGSGDAREFEVRLFGAIQARFRGEPLELGGLKARSVLAALALKPNKVVAREQIIAAAWRGQRIDAPKTVRKLVGDYISDLGKALKPAEGLVELRAENPGFVLVVAQNGAEVIDAVRFRALLHDAAGARHTADREVEAALLQEAVDSWRGEHLALADVEADGLRIEAAALQDERRAALVRLAALYVSDSQAARAWQLLVSEARRTPADDDVAVGLIEALSADARPTEAFSTARQIAAARRELSVPVGPRLKAALGQARIAAAAADGGISLLRQLPDGPRNFTGREAELAKLLALADTASGQAASTVVIDGMGGVGKSALAVHAAHRLADRFPDGQLYVELHGFTPGVPPRAATDVLADILRAFAIPAPQIPDDPEARAALYRDRLAGRRVLIVLDNAVSEDQIRPLLPGTSGYLVVVTSRVRLKALDDALVLSLDPLPLPDALRLLRSIAGPDRIPANDPLLEQIAEWCGRLPLALRIAGALMRNRSAWTLQDLARRLKEQRKRLAALSDNKRHLAAILALSYDALAEDQQSLFRHLGLYPGADVDSYAAAALLDIDPDSADALLQLLVDQNLLSESASGRYQLHDLLRLYAQSLADAIPAPQRSEVLNRLSGYYHHTANRAELLIFSDSQGEVLQNAPYKPRYPPALDTPQQAKGWFARNLENQLDAYKANALASVAVVVTYPAVMHAGARSIGPWWLTAGERQVCENYNQLVRVIQVVFRQARSGDSEGFFEALSQLITGSRDLSAATGQVLTETVQHQASRHDQVTPQSAASQTQSGGTQSPQVPETDAVSFLETWARQAAPVMSLQQAAQRLSASSVQELEANVAAWNAWTLLWAGDHDGAIDGLRDAINGYRAVGEQRGEALALAVLGTAQYLKGMHPDAARTFTALERIGDALKDSRLQAQARVGLGIVSYLQEEMTDAVEHFQQASALCQDPCEWQDRIEIDGWLAAIHRARGDYESAAQLLAAALGEYDTRGVRDGKLATLTRYGWVRARLGDLVEAAAILSEALETSRELGLPIDEVECLEALGEVHVQQGDIVGGLARLREAQDICRLYAIPEQQRIATRITELTATSGT